MSSDTLYDKLDNEGFDLSRDWDHETNSRLIFSFPNWDTYPGMLKGTDKRVASKRLMWFELLKGADGIRAMFIIGPGETDARRKLLQALIDGKADTGRQTSIEKMSPEFSTLGSTWLLDNRKRENSLEDIDSLYKNAVDTLEKFLVSQLQKLKAALSQS